MGANGSKQQQKLLDLFKPEEIEQTKQIFSSIQNEGN